MSRIKVKQRPIQIPSARKRDLRTQFGALCYRVQKDKVQILLITSRGRKRWIIPKGWPMDGATPSQAAQQEAYEEAGAEGKVTGDCLGIYSYMKNRDSEFATPCVVAIFPLKVKRLLSNYPEKNERKRRWFSLKNAAMELDEPELCQIVKNFVPPQLTK